MASHLALEINFQFVFCPITRDFLWEPWRERREWCDDLYDCKAGCQDVSNEPIAVLSCLVRELLLTAPCEFHTLKGILVFFSVSESIEVQDIECCLFIQTGDTWRCRLQDH